MDEDRNMWIVIFIVALAFIGVIGYDLRVNHRLDKWTNGDNWQWSDDWTNSRATPLMNNSDSGSSQMAPPQGPQATASTYEEALKLSRELRKPILIIFNADWCHWCKKFEAEVMPSQDVVRSISSYVLVKINVDKEKQIVKKFNVSAIPAFVITNHQEANLKSHSGYMTSVDFCKWLNDPKMLETPIPEEPKKEEIKPPEQPKMKPDLFPNRPKDRPLDINPPGG